MTVKLLRAALSSAQDLDSLAMEEAKFPLSLPTQGQDGRAQPDDHERMKAMVEATGKQMAVGSHVSQEELQRALLFLSYTCILMMARFPMTYCTHII